LLGLIAGDGGLPLEIAHSAAAAGRKVLAIAFEGVTDPQLAEEVAELRWLRLGELEKLLAVLAEAKVAEAVLAGKVSKRFLYGDLESMRPDSLALGLLDDLSDRRDDSILSAVADLLERNRVHLIPQLQYCPHLVPGPGPLGRSEASGCQRADIEFGWAVAKAMGELDIGQSVVVESHAVLAVEAIEGTDEALRRGGGLGHGGACLIKVAKPSQDPRFDVPTVGLATLETMLESGVSVLAFEAHCTIILDREELVALADAKKVPLIGVDSAATESSSPALESGRVSR
jgi:DUF1009 family protein